MNLRDELDNMDLPLVNPNEDLETLSRQKLMLLFDATKFEIRPEEFRDKGIDFNIEIKKNGKYTNFRGVIQLKATDSVLQNTDGSYSIQLESSNINYLLNSALPAFYILYVKNQDQFFVEDLNDFVKSLSAKNIELANQKSHTLRFNKILDEKALEYVYDSMLRKGKFQRKIHESIALLSSTLTQNEKILIDINLNVTTDNDIRSAIEKYGILLDSEGRWNEIIRLHTQGSGLIASTSKYNLFVGIAYFQTGNLSEAMTFFKTATKLKGQLSEQLQNHLHFFDITTKYSIGILSETEYLQQIAELEVHPSIGLYVKLDRAKRAYLMAEETSEARFNNFHNDIQSIIDDHNANTNIILEAKCELVLHEGYRNNIRYVKDISGLNTLEEGLGTDVYARINHAKTFAVKFMEWYNNVQNLRKEAFDSKHYFTYYHVLLTEVKVTYEFSVYRKAIQDQRETAGFPKEEMYDQSVVFDPLLKMLEEALEYYDNINHVLNKAAALAQKYEIMHYVGNSKEAQDTFSELENLVNNYDLVELKKRFAHLKKEGPMHTSFDIWLKNIFEKRKKYITTSKQQASEMTDMDSNDMQAIKLEGNCYKIHLFPIGYFQFPKEKLQVVFEILNVSVDSTKKQFENMLIHEIIPIANVYNNPITMEGPLNGILADKGVGWENLYRVRKAFYINKFHKV